jgi:hypothetical protein
VLLTVLLGNSFKPVVNLNVNYFSKSQGKNVFQYRAADFIGARIEVVRLERVYLFIFDDVFIIKAKGVLKLDGALF